MGPVDERAPERIPVCLAADSGHAPVGLPDRGVAKRMSWSNPLPAMYEAPVPQAGLAPVRQRLPMISVLVGLFIIPACGLAVFSGWNYVVKGLGAVLVLAFVIRAFSGGASVCPETILYGTWVVWSMIAVIGGVYEPLFWPQWFTVAQTLILIAIIAGFTNSRKILLFNLIMFLLAATLWGGMSVATGDFQRAEEEGERAGSFVGANGFGFMMLMATVAMAHFWMLRTRRPILRYVVLGTGMATASMFVILSGSRKAILALALFYALWVWYCYRKEVFARGKVFAAVLVLTAAGSYGAYRMIAGTYLEERFKASLSVITGGGRKHGGGGQERIRLYRVGFTLIGRRPFIGNGLDNYRMHTGGVMSHSDLLAVAVATGIPGLGLYLAIYILLYRRAGRIAKFSADPTEIKFAKLVRATIIVILLMSLGRKNYHAKDFWVIFGSLIGYTHAVWQSLQARLALSIEMSGAAPAGSS